MTKRWCEYQKALKPVSLSKGLGSLTRLLLNHRVANVKAITIRITIKIPVTPSSPRIRSIYLGLCFPKSSIRYCLYIWSDSFISLGKSQARWLPAWRITPITMAAAIVCTNPLTKSNEIRGETQFDAPYLSSTYVNFWSTRFK